MKFEEKILFFNQEKARELVGEVLSIILRLHLPVFNYASDA